jgi:hypothetical protein
MGLLVVLPGMASRRHFMNLLDAPSAAGVPVNAAEFARERGVSVRAVYRHRACTGPRAGAKVPAGADQPADDAAGGDGWICRLRAELRPDNVADFIRDALLDMYTRRPSGSMRMQSGVPAPIGVLSESPRYILTAGGQNALRTLCAYGNRLRRGRKRDGRSVIDPVCRWCSIFCRRGYGVQRAT